MISTKRLILLVLLFLVILFTPIILWSAHMHSYGVALTIQAAPKSAKMTINGKARSPGTYHVRPGTYVVTAKLAGFADDQTTVVIKTNRSAFAGVALSSNSNATQNYYTNHPNDQKLIETISSKNSDELSTELNEQYPFLKMLPYQATGFRIDYGAGTSTLKPAFYITTSNPGAKQTALDWIKREGGDPTQLSIQYVSNPLLDRLPYKTVAFQLTNGGFTSGDGTPFPRLYATINLSSADLADRDDSVAGYKQQINAYIISQGAKPTDFNISYTITP